MYVRKCTDVLQRKAPFTRREGNPTAGVTLVEGSKIAPVYKQNLIGWVTLSPGTTLNDLGNRTGLETSEKLSRVAERLQGRSGYPGARVKCTKLYALRQLRM